MGIGPITILDKSTLQGLNVDEACWLDHFYLVNITPLFYVETLADLKKEVARGRTPEQVVGNLAYKTPPSGTPNANHIDLCLGNLFGQEIETGRIQVAGGRRVKHGDQTGVIFEQLPEFIAFQRWQEGNFLEVEYQFASEWRLKLSRLDLEGAKTSLRSLVGEYPKPATLKEAKVLADQLVSGDRNRFRLLKAAFELLNVPQYYRSSIIDRWKATGGIPFPQFASYAAHVLSVDLFFYIAVAADLISTSDPKNKIDTAYLYYLPFCMVFISNDRLHKKIVPLFLAPKQVFVAGEDLKADLRRLDSYYSQFSEEIEVQGIMRFAPAPPKEGEFLTAQLWDRFCPAWRKNVKANGQRSPEKDAALVARMKDMSEGAKGCKVTNNLEPDYMMVSHMVPIRMGKWRVLPPEVEKDLDR